MYNLFMIQMDYNFKPDNSKNILRLFCHSETVQDVSLTANALTKQFFEKKN